MADLLFHFWIQLPCLCWNRYRFTVLVEFKPVKQEVSRTVILPLMKWVSVLWYIAEAYGFIRFDTCVDARELAPPSQQLNNNNNNSTTATQNFALPVKKISFKFHNWHFSSWLAAVVVAAAQDLNLVPLLLLFRFLLFCFFASLYASTD